MSRSQPRIALIVPVFPVLSETFIVRQWLGLLDRGWDVHMVCQRFDAKAWRRAESLRRPDLRARIHAVGPTHSKRRAAIHLPVTIGRLSQRPFATATHARRSASEGIPRAVRRLYLDAPLIKIQPDLIHFEFGSLAPDRMDLGRLLNARLVVSFRGFDLNFVGLEKQGYYDPVWQYADHLHFLGTDLWQRAQGRGCPADKPHTLISPAVDAERFAPDLTSRPTDKGSKDPGSKGPGSKGPGSKSPGSKGPLRIVSVGRLEWKKGYDYAIRAIRQLVDADIALSYTLIGEGNELQSIAYARHQLGLEDVVHLAGPLPHNEVLKTLQQADVFLHPAVSEGFCNAVLEAQAMELPVVATDADGLRENLSDGETGFVVPRRDPDALAHRLEQLARDPELRRRMGKAGRRRVCDHFRPEQEIDGFERLYRQALTAPGS